MADHNKKGAYLVGVYTPILGRGRCPHESDIGTRKKGCSRRSVMGLDRPERSEVVYCEINLGPSALAARPSPTKKEKSQVRMEVHLFRPVPVHKNGIACADTFFTPALT